MPTKSEIYRLWQAGGLMIGELGRVTTANDEVQELLTEIAELWAVKLGTALGVVSPEHATEFQGFAVEMKRINREARS